MKTGMETSSGEWQHLFLAGVQQSLGSALAKAADETRRFRHRAAHNDDSFEVSASSRTIEAAQVLANGLGPEILAFKNVIDPPGDEQER